MCLDKKLCCCNLLSATNKCNKIYIIQDYIIEIIYNLKLLYININENEFFNDPLVADIKNIQKEKIQDFLYIYKNNHIYVIKNNILYYVYKDELYYIKNNYYYKFGNNDTTNDVINIIKFNDLIDYKSKIILLLQGINNIINKFVIAHKNFVYLLDSKLYIKNACFGIIKIINLSLFYYSENNILYLKDIIWFFNDINQVGTILEYIIYLINNLHLLIKHIMTYN